MSLISKKLISSINFSLKRPTVAFVNSYNNDNITCIDISDPSNLSQISSYSTTSLNEVIRILVDYKRKIAYAACDAQSKIVSLDISDLSNINTLDVINFNSFSTDIDIALDINDNVLYAFFGGILISIDVSNPSNMSEIGRSSTSAPDGRISGGHISIDLDNKKAYTSRSYYNPDIFQSAQTFAKYSISDPSNITLDDALGIFYGGTPFVPFLYSSKIELDLTNNVAFTLGIFRSNIRVINIDPNSSLQDLGNFPSSGNSLSITSFKADFKNKILYYVNVNSDSIILLDISSPKPVSNISVINTYSPSINFVSSSAYSIEHDPACRILYIQNSGIIHSIDVSNPSNISLLDSFNSPTLSGGFSGISLNLINSSATNAFSRKDIC